MKDTVECDTSEHVAQLTYTSLLDETAPKDLPSKGAHHLSRSWGSLFFLLTAKHPLQLQKKLHFEIKAPIVKVLLKPLWLHHCNSGCKNTEWQLNIQMVPFKLSVISLIELRWTLSFQDWYGCADDRVCIRCPSCLQTHTLHSSGVRSRSSNVNHRSFVQCK